MSFVDDPHSESSNEDPIPSNPNHNNNDTASPDRESAPKCSIHILSHGHRFGPFTPLTNFPSELSPTILQYDIRALPNPPKNVRAQQTGLHKSLREWFFSRPEAVQKLEDMCAAVNAAVANVSERRVYPAKIYVVVFCEMGKHRSVAFAEELSRRAFFVDGEDGPEKCQMVLQHRDVARGKHESRSKKQRVDRADS
ncbi:hypothetical protein C8R44DRAFT_686642 [Mycena epipterygia]|nr:hypothetical protein C8R44DRAFT_686642 [Mycena epipterygia]